MIVDEQAIDSAILGIFFDLHLPPEGRLAYPALQKEWPNQGYRAADLDIGLARLLQRGHLRIEHDAGSRMVVLTEAGYGHGESFGSVLTILRSNLDSLGRALGLVTPRQQRSSRNNARRHRVTDAQDTLEFARGVRLS